jgi:transcriptional regulator with XRE-family HTH domain
LGGPARLAFIVFSEAYQRLRLNPAPWPSKLTSLFWFFKLGSSMRAKANEPVDSLVGARIRLLRKRRKMSQAELGKAIGVTFQQIQKYENGKNRIGAGRLHLVATSLNVPIAELFDSVAESARTLKATKSLAFDSQAFRIAEAFVKISDKQVRSSLVDLAEAMARKSGAR